MTSLGKWSATTLTTILTTELNSLGSGSMSVASAAYDNTTNKDIYADLELNLGSISPTAGGYCACYIAEQADGSNFPAPGAGDMRAQGGNVLCTFPMSSTATTAQRLIIRQVQIPPTQFKLYIDNQSGGAMAASGNTLKLLSYGFNLNA